MAKKLSGIVFGAILMFPAGVALGQPPFYVQDVREVCQLPRQDNDGNVVGHDNGSSVLFNGTSYWFFADTILDGNGNGFHDPGDAGAGGFIGQGTAAKTTDLDASDCMEMSYRASGGVAQQVYPASEKKPDECLLWPAGAVVANNQIYLFGHAVKKNGQGQCLLGNPIEKFLSRIDPVTLQGTRLVTTQEPNEPSFGAPFNVSEPDGCGGQIKWVYMVGSKALPPVPGFNWPVQGYLMARVPEAQIEDPTKYQYWDGAQWVLDDPSAAEPLFDEVFASNHTGVTYNQELGRYMMVYTCDVTGAVCARTAEIPGTTPDALVGAWSERVKLYNCPGEFFHCYAANVHPEYGDGSTIYITTARLTPRPATQCTQDSDCQCPDDPNPVNQCNNGTCTTPNANPRYRLRLREVKIGTTPPPGGRVFADAGRDYTPKWSYPSGPGGTCSEPVQGANGWTYERLDGSTLSDLTYDYLWNWKGPDFIGLFPAPLINEDTSLPGTNTDAVRVWEAPGAGTIRISGEARKKQLCGDETIAEIIRIQGDSPVGGPLWSYTFDPNDRTALYDVTTTVADGDAIGFKVKRGGATAGCDEVFMAPTITYTP